MAADPKQLRAPARQADPIDSQFYTASLSAYLQGAEIVQFYRGKITD